MNINGTDKSLPRLDSSICPALSLPSTVERGTYRTRQPKMSSLGVGVRLREVVAFENLDHNGSKCFPVRIW